MSLLSWINVSAPINAPRLDFEWKVSRKIMMERNGNFSLSLYGLGSEQAGSFEVD